MECWKVVVGFIMCINYIKPGVCHRGGQLGQMCINLASVIGTDNLDKLGYFFSDFFKFIAFSVKKPKTKTHSPFNIIHKSNNLLSREVI